MQSSYQPGTGSTRAGSIPMMRFQPYGVSCTHPNEYRDAETGTSTLVPPSASYVGPPTPQPSGGISETTVGAEDNNTTKDEDKAAVSNFYCSRIPHIIELSSGVRPLRRQGALAAKDDIARTARGRRHSLTCCAPGCSDIRVSENLRASTGL